MEIGRAIVSRYTEFASRLRNMVDSKKVRTHYVSGNHDYIVQLSPGLRELVVNFLALNHPTDQPFGPVYTCDQDLIFAVHGHCYDPVNWHRQTEGYWAMGDAIVLRVVNRFIVDATRALGVGLNSEIGRHLQDIDYVEPTSDIPLYVRWVGENLSI